MSDLTEGGPDNPGGDWLLYNLEHMGSPTAEEAAKRLRAALAEVARLTEQRDMMDQAHEIEMETHLSTLARAALAAAVAEEREAILGMVCEAGEPTCCNLPVETIGTYGPEQECCGSPIYSITDLKPLTDEIRARAAKEGA